MLTGIPNMAKITLHHADAIKINTMADLIMTDPPFDMPAAQLAGILDGIQAEHLVLITTMRQLLGLVKCSDWELAFDFVLDAVTPKKSMSLQQPNYTHATGVYMTRPGAKSIFNRKRRQRSDTFDNKGYWPTVLRAPRERLADHGMAKNQTAITDILGCFDVSHVCDPFAGSGTVGLAAYELEIDCTLIEKDQQHYALLEQTFRFLR